jgi:tetratricopeptide (TPR) repeat protein
MTRTALLLFVITFACSVCALGPLSASGTSSPREAEAHEKLEEVPKPNLTGVDLPVQNQIQSAEKGLTATLNLNAARGVQKARAFGSLGKIYQAYGFDDAAMACYANAAKLDPLAFRWHYYLAYLHEKRGDSKLAASQYQQALSIKPNDALTMLRLGNLELDLNELTLARSYLGNPLVRRTAPAAALSGLGKIALAEHQYQEALKYFTEALQSDPSASSIHYHLAKAYRALGDFQQMDENLRARGETEPVAPDPLLEEIDTLRQSRLDLWKRGNVAMHEERFADAVATYKQMVELKPSDPIGYIYLAEALAATGEIHKALDQYKRALQFDPHNAVVHYNMGVLYTQAKSEEMAITHFRSAIRYDPETVATHFDLANLLMRRGKDEEAGREYGIVVSAEPQNSFARLMQAMAAVHAGAYSQARSLLEEGLRRLPGDPGIANALARILAAAPDPAVRDEPRAFKNIQTLIQTEQGMDFETGVTLGMALAAVGQFKDAAACQINMIHELEAAGRSDLAKLLQENLVRYQRNEASRRPWASDDPIFTPIVRKSQPATQAISERPDTDPKREN